MRLFDPQILLNSLEEPAIMLHEDGLLAAVNRAWLNSPQLHGGNSADEEASRYLEWYECRPALRDGVAEVLSGERALDEQEIAVQSGDKEMVYVARIVPMIADPSEIVGALVRFEDVTEQRKLERTLMMGSEQYRQVADYSDDMIKLMDLHGNIEYVSPSHQRILGCKETNIFDTVHPEDRAQLKKVYDELIRGGRSGVFELRKKNNHGDWIWVEASASPVMAEDGTVKKILFISRNINERKHAQAELERMAYHDHLTGLYNRRKITMLMKEALQEAECGKERFAILIMDLDKFKSINDTYGHDVGDLVLKEFSKRLLQCKRGSDSVGRLSGDEFAVIMRGIAGREEVERFIRRIRQAMAEPGFMKETGNGIRISPSIGSSIYPDHGHTMRELFKCADVALYREKNQERKLRLNTIIR